MKGYVYPFHLFKGVISFVEGCLHHSGDRCKTKPKVCLSVLVNRKQKEKKKDTTSSGSRRPDEQQERFVALTMEGFSDKAQLHLSKFKMKARRPITLLPLGANQIHERNPVTNEQTYCARTHKQRHVHTRTQTESHTHRRTHIHKQAHRNTQT